ncbi:hypothetical protein D3C76_1646070 [compost metagenome]
MNVPGHLCTPCGKGHAVQRRAGVGDLPDTSLEVEFIPAGETQLTGAYEHMQRQHHREARERATFVAVDTRL